MTACVTGATGLVGSHIVRSLLRRGEAVRALVRPTSDARALETLRVETSVGDVLERRSLSTAMHGCDVVFHAAAHFAYAGKTADEIHQTATAGTSNVLAAAAAAGVTRVVVTSSSIVHGYSTTPVLCDERSSAECAGESAYVRSKIEQDQVAVQEARRLGIEMVLVCPTVVVGPFAPSLGPSNALITGYLEDPFRLTYPGGCNIVAASDVGRAHVLLAESGVAGERYIIGGENLEWRALHAMISEMSGTTGPSATAPQTVCYLAAALEELRAEVGGATPRATRSQAAMLGRFYWYSHAKAAAIGFQPMAARAAVATALSWLAAHHLSREARARIRLSEDVWTMRTRLRDSEAALRCRA